MTYTLSSRPPVILLLSGGAWHRHNLWPPWLLCGRDEATRFPATALRIGHCVLPRLNPRHVAFLGSEYGLVAEHYRDHLDVHSVKQRLDREGVAKHVGMRPLG